MLAHDLAAVLPDLQAHAESRMGAPFGSTADVRRRTGRMVQDETSGREVPEWEIVLPEVPCRIGSDKGSAPSRTVSTPGGDVQLGTRTAHFPAATEGLRDGDMVDIIAGRLAGTVWQIVEADDADQQTARRVPVIAVQRPQEWL